MDPNLTSYETLRNLLSRAFDLKDDIGEFCEIPVPMLSDQGDAVCFTILKIPLSLEKLNF